MQEQPREIRAFELPFDVVDAASEASFPASDAPGWATGQRYRVEPMEDAAATEREALRHRRDDQDSRPARPQRVDGRDT